MTDGPPDLSARDILGPDGLIATRLPNWESRPQQLQMADAVADAIRRQRHLVVEAGTGVGKSLAYLVPAVLAATEDQGRRDGSGGEEDDRRRVVISTHTISLQEQLIGKDIPLLNSVIPREFSAVLVKGRGNYVSLRRLKAAGERDQIGNLFDNTGDARQLRRLYGWASETTDGSRADLDFAVSPAVWDEVRSEHGNCLGRKCPTFQDCHYYKARRRVGNADVLVVNHALFFSDLALRREGVSLLPDYETVILDEAHTIEDVAGDHLGLSISDASLTYLMNRLANERQGKGLCFTFNLVQAKTLVARIREEAGGLFEQVGRLLTKAGGEGRTMRFRERPPLDNRVSDRLTQLAGVLRRDADTIPSAEQAIEITSAADRVEQAAATLTAWVEQRQEDSVYWVERTGRQRLTTKLLSAPVEVGPVLREELFGATPSVVLTSATLTVGREDFVYFRDRVGLTEGDTLKLGSPFDYRRQATLVLADRMPDPSREAARFEEACADRIMTEVSRAGGRAFVLFTSYGMMRKVASRVGRWAAAENMTLLVQGEDLPRGRMIEKFVAEERACLFGTDTFWQGVDVPGDDLQLVIIVRLPFRVPDHPLLEARLDKIRERGGNPFIEYQVPEAAIKLKQGFGRLIRTRSDTGRVVILDPRMTTKPYGRTFRESLPECGRG